MNEWYLAVRKSLREIYSKALDAQRQWRAGDEKSANTIHEYLRKDYRSLQNLWNEKFEGAVPTYLGRHIGFGMANDVDDILTQDLPQLQERLDGFLEAAAKQTGEDGFFHLLHPAVVTSSYELYLSGNFRESVLNSVVAIFDLIRKRTGIDLDGSDLVNRAFSLKDPYLILSELQSETGKNDQKGFMQIFCGSYQGIRNPKAHSLNHDLTKVKASQYLVHASLLARRVSEAQTVKVVPSTMKQPKSKRDEPSRS